MGTSAAEIKYHYDVQAIKDRLMAYRDNEAEINNQLERIDDLDLRMKSIGSPVISDMPRSNSFGDRIASFVAQKDELERKVRELIDHQVEEQRWIDGVLLHIGNANERAVIRMRYVDAKSWPNVSKMIFGRNEDYEEKADSYLRRTTKLHGRALVDMATYISEHEM